MTTKDTLARHENFSTADYFHLSDKGYTDQEILGIWDRDLAAGRGPVTSYDFNKTVQYFSNK